MSNFAFGTYRVSDINPQHIEALKEAIESGITMIDTSSNYMDGGAERAIALAFREFDKSKRDEVEIVSKFGYIQGTALAEFKENSHTFKEDIEIVRFADDCYHSISENFLRSELSKSLKRLEMQKIDCYLIHNPEYYILDAIKQGISRDDRLDEMYKRIERAFVGLEKEVKNGRINSYGISSNSFSALQNSDEFLPYKDLIVLAQNAADEVGNEKNSFSTIELPINLLETEGLRCAMWAHENEIRVLANRPLNAKIQNKMFRLADYEENGAYYSSFNELMEICETEALEPIYNLLEQLDDYKHKFSWIGDLDIFLYQQVIPHIEKSMRNIDDALKEELFTLIDKYLWEYKKIVAYECSRKTRIELNEFFSGCSSSMQECSIDFLMQKKSINYIIVGMRKPIYVHQILSLNR
ncbi:aldo/keto reductase [Sulfurimonas sp.]|uniref:aldo/keto reductase n=1 Tax=Sulfurimonas sp. TaxID=2022749 RepID=UPI0025FB35A3|nr:aldo/keto reductase [Sulfurimonas sp.]MDD5157834.1 aldo/keto reductase [Sulfurimonas sp.]